MDKRRAGIRLPELGNGQVDSCGVAVIRRWISEDAAIMKWVLPGLLALLALLVIAFLIFRTA